MAQLKVDARSALQVVAAFVLLLASTVSAHGNLWEYGVLRYAPTEMAWESTEHVVGPYRNADRLADAIRSVHGLPIGEESSVVYVLNILGQFGWELVAHYQNYFIFKRPLSSGP